ncbi:MAG TPA: adenylate/guanylate cyclase domain-containing protein, partial [Acidobacteriota bacterium]|nr:adenylate/guanylate cyclase domain-containing protein [Acidobacteriota bacterium]
MQLAKNKRVFRLLLYLAVVSFSVALAILFQSSSLGQGIEQRTYDLRFKLRGPLPPTANSPITIVAVDDESYDRIPDPLMLWHKYFAQVVRGLVEARAAVIGLDFFFADIEKYDPEGQRALLAAILEAGSANVPVILVYQVRRDRPEQPPAQFMMAAGEAFAYANLTTDIDDFVRRQALYSEDSSRGSSFPFAVALAFARKQDPPIIALEKIPKMVLINYRGLDLFPRVSFSTTLDAARSGDIKFLRDHFQNRIALIGRVSIEDLHSTPLYYWDRSKSQESFKRTPGIEIHAHTIATLLQGNFIRQPTGRVQLALTVLIVCLVVFFCFRLPPLAGLGLSGVVLVSYLFFSNWIFGRGWWLSVVSPVAGALLAAGTAEVSNFILEGREKQHLRRLFKRYVNDQVIEKILQAPGGLTLKGETRRITVLFSDIRDFTTRSEGVAAEVLVNYLNDYFTEMVDAIQAHGGMVDKFIGDGMMAVFGAPLDDLLAPLHAVEAAREMLSKLRSFNQQLASQGIEPVRIGIGIHSGEAVVGNIGSPQKTEYTAIGDVVNTA